MDANPHTPAIFESRVALSVWCLLAGLALAPLPAFHALPEGFLIYLFEPPTGWTRLTKTEIFYFTLFGLPLTPIFLAWASPGAGHPGVPMRSIIALCLLVAYNPVRYYFETHFYGDAVARMVIYDEAWTAGWIVRHLDSLLLLGLAAVAILRRQRLQPLPKILFHWILFICALWVVGPPLYDIMFYRLLSF